MSAPDHDETVHHLEDGWTVRVSVPVEEEIHYNGGHTSQGFGVVHTSDEAEESSVGGLIAAIEARQDAIRADLARTPRLTVDVARDGIAVRMLDEARSETDPNAELLWPPVVTGAGLVLRWVSETPRDTVIQPARFVDRSGAVRALPFELAVRPLGGDAAGRLLLPCLDPLWWDGTDEPFTWLGLDGETEPLLIGGLPVTPTRICTAIGEPFINGDEDPDTDGPLWEPVQGRRDDDELTVRLVADIDSGRRWVTVVLPLVGHWAVRVTERGAGADDAPLPPL